jgi:hypothetical protein
MRTGLVALLLVAIAAPALADSREVGVVVQGNAKLETDVRAAVDGAGFSPVRKPLSRDGLDTLANCFIIEDLQCARSVVEARSKTPRLVFVRTDDATAIVTWFSVGHAPLVERGDCAACAVDKLARSAPDPIVKAEQPIWHEKHSRTLPALLIGAGAATLVTGGVLLYYGMRDGASHKYVYPQLTPAGIALLAVGGGAVIGGVITW